jgi:Flp pilus assembly protein TadB
MENRDLTMLTEAEQKVLDLSFQPGLSERRMRNIAINAFLVLVALVLFVAYQVGVIWISGVATAILVVSAVEKFSYARVMLDQKSLVRKLVNRVEQLEGSNPTVLGTHPAARMRRQLELDRVRTET